MQRIRIPLRAFTVNVVYGGYYIIVSKTQQLYLHFQCYYHDIKCMEVITLSKTINKSNHTNVIITNIKCMEVIIVLKYPSKCTFNLNVIILSVWRLHKSLRTLLSAIAPSYTQYSPDLHSTCH